MCVFYIIYIFVIYIIDIYIIYIFIIYIYLSTPPESCEKHLTLERKKKKAWKLYREKKISENLLILSGISKKQLHPWNKML